MGSSTRLLGILLLAAAAPGCSWLRAVPDDDTPPEAPGARVFRMLPPARRDELLPPERRFAAREWLDRLICAFGDQPAWRRSGGRDEKLRYEVRCPGEAPTGVTLDTTDDPPSAPHGMRLLDPAGVGQFRSAFVQAEKRDYRGALAMMDAALAAVPGEPVFRRERIFLLWALGRTPEALVEADSLLETFPTPLVHKYRALAARDLGLRGEMMGSLDAIVQACPDAHPLFAEALCAKGMLLSAENADGAGSLLFRGCRMGQRSCCDTLTARSIGETMMRRFVRPPPARASDLTEPSLLPHPPEKDPEPVPESEPESATDEGNPAASPPDSATRPPSPVPPAAPPAPALGDPSEPGAPPAADKPADKTEPPEPPPANAI